MKKFLTFLFCLILALNMSAQCDWTNSLNRGHRMAYATSTDGQAIAKLEIVKGKLCFYVEVPHICESNPAVDFEFVIDGGGYHHTLLTKSVNNKSLIIFPNLMKSVADNWRKDFFNSTRFFVRVLYRHMDPVTFEFYCFGSRDAFQFVKGK